MIYYCTLSYKNTYKIEPFEYEMRSSHKIWENCEIDQ